MSGGAGERRLLIVNADDLGRTEGINVGVFAAHREGIVTSATLMVAFPAAETAAAALADHPDLGVGLHVMLTGARPTLPAERLGSLVDGEGRLPRKPDRLAAIDADPAEVRAEVRHQLDRFRELVGRLPTHLDSHHHSHRLPVVLDAVVELAREHRLPVRNAGAAVAWRLRAERLATTERFEEGFYGEATGPEDLRRLLAAAGRSGARSVELMCHPARVDAELAAGSTYTTERERELATLTDPAARRAVEAAGFRLETFAALG